MTSFLKFLPEVQNAVSSFRLHDELIKPTYVNQLFQTKKINRFCLDTVFGSRDVNFTHVLQALGVNMALVPPGWAKMTLHSTLRDEGNRNSNVFNMVYVGRNSCALAVNVIALVLAAPFFQTDNIMILHQLQQRHVTTRAIEFAMARQVPRVYWPSGPIPTLQLDHHGKWVNVRMDREEAADFCPVFFDRTVNVEWYGMQPRMKSKVSPMVPFYEEESAVCASIVGLVKRMVDGVNLGNQSVQIEDYEEVIGNFKGGDAPPCYFEVRQDLRNHYIFMNPSGDFFLVRMEMQEGRLDAVWVHLQLVERQYGLATVDVSPPVSFSAGSLHDKLNEVNAYPYPRIIAERLVSLHATVRSNYEGLSSGRPTSDFGIIRKNEEGRWLDDEGYYSVEVKDTDTDQRFRVKISVANVSAVLVSELHKMVLPFVYVPNSRGLFFLPTREAEGMVFVYNIPSDVVTVC
eukprot:767856-Hanusia_phi.AAC.2